MAIKPKSELLSQLKGITGEEMTDEAIAFMEDISDTLSDFESRTADNTDWKKRYEENDNSWREKYTSRFFNAGAEDEPEPVPEPEKVYKTFDDLFSNQ